MSELITRDGDRIAVDPDLSSVVDAIATLRAERATAALADRVEAVLRSLVAQFNEALSERVAPVENLTLQVVAPAPPVEPAAVVKTFETDADGRISRVIERREP